jgi:predicted ATPase/class 3 adenylate cyclase
MQNNDAEALRAAIEALEGQRATLGDTALELALAPLRARLASLVAPASLKLRQITVLFVDVVEATALEQGLGSENALGLLGNTLRHMADIVQAHQGRVLRFTGDGVKAAFGMDQAREDDAERAVRAGLAMLAAARQHAEAANRLHGVADFAVRVGVHTGEVALGAGVEADNTAMGAAVNIAARMEQSAPPGGLRISAETWNLVRGLFDVEAQPQLMVKGVAEPMKTYLVLGARERSSASVERGVQGLATPMVGRDADLQRLLDAVLRAGETRQLQSLTLLGDAGLGKSRLLREFTAALIARKADCRVLSLRSQPDGLLRVFGLLRALLATQCGMADTDSAEVARHKVVEGLGPWFGDRGERQSQLIGQLAGLDFADSPTVKNLDPRSLRDQAFAAVRGYFQALAAHGALPVLVVEDLHWADDGSLDLLQDWLAHAAELPLALVMSARPALLARRPGWATPDTTVQLGTLAATESATLAGALLQRIAQPPPRLSELIIGRAEGNPYYMEELVRRLIDDAVIVVGDPHWTVHAERLGALRLPPTLVGLLQARLDALPAGERQAARQASIVGHVFWDDALQALDADAPKALPALQRAAIVKDRDGSDFEGTPERQFDHHLLHQVTYETLLKSERKLGHGAAARWLSERTQGRGAEFLAMTGEHAERAGETALAIDCFDSAASEAVKRFANAAATSWLRRAVALLGESEAMRRFDLLHRLDEISELIGDRSAQDAVHADMAVLLERHPDDSQQGRLLQRRALLAHRRGDRQASEQHALQAVALAERCGPAKTACQSHVMLSFIQLMRLDLERARSHADAALHWAARMEPSAETDAIEDGVRISSALVSIRMNRFDEARVALHEALARREAQGSLLQQYGALHYLLEIESTLARYDEVLALAMRMQKLARSLGALPREVTVLCVLAEVSEAKGEQATAIGLYEQCLPLCRAANERRQEALVLFGLGRAHRELGDVTSALRWHSEAHGLFQDQGRGGDAIENEACIALCRAQLGQHTEALAAVNSLLDELDDSAENMSASATINLRWTCQQVLGMLGDLRAEPMLAQLHADIQQRASELTDITDRDRLIQATPVFRNVVAAYRRTRGMSAPLAFDDA